MGRYTTGGVGRDVIAGAIAGGAAVWLINKMDWSLSHAGRAEASAPATNPAHAAAAKAADAAGVRVNENQQRLAGHTVHYGVGIGIGALYGLLRGMAPSVTTGRGSLFGVATFILGDEVGASAMGLTRGPLNYPAGDHAKSAMAHVVFGLLTDLGTRLLSPWKDNVVIVRGPSLNERVEEGRQAIADSRDYLYDQGRYVLDQGRTYAQQAREQLDEYDVPSKARTGGRRARELAERIRSNLPDADDVMDYVDQGRRHVSRLAGAVASQLPDQDDVSDVVERGRKHGRKLSKRAKERLPERDDIDDAVTSGRKRVQRLADDARDSGQSMLGKVSSWLFG